MTNALVIEAGDAPAGVIVRERGGWLFYAAADAFRPLDSRRFRSPRDAARAAERLLAPARGDAGGRHAAAA
jgi:hypothetical protein